jgi:hypothetical protein
MDKSFWISQEQLIELPHELFMRVSYYECKTNTLTILMHSADAHFDNSSLFSDAKSKTLKIREKKMLKLKEPSDENQTECHETEPNPSTDRAMPEKYNQLTNG